jgi:hypothetical protein
MKHPDQPARLGEDNTADTSTAIEVAERRSAERQPFVAEAQIVEVSSGVRLSARSCDLVAHGCYVDTLIPFPVGTVVRIRLKKDKTIVEANGRVAYRLPGLGMGIAFHDLTPETQAAVEKWFSHLHGQHESVEVLLPPIEPVQPASMQRQPGTAFVELIQLLMRKGVVTKTEAISLLQTSLDE